MFSSHIRNQISDKPDIFYLPAPCPLKWEVQINRLIIYTRILAVNSVKIRNYSSYIGYINNFSTQLQDNINNQRLYKLLKPSEASQQGFQNDGEKIQGIGTGIL